MITLGIHTAGQFCGAALLDGDLTLCEHSEPMKRGHDQRLPMVVSDVMTAAGLGFSDVGRIAICVGPGSFTGIRVGVAFARGLALANGLTAEGVTSLEALASKPPSIPTLALIPARIRPPDQSFWAQSFSTDEASEPYELDADKLTSVLGPETDIMTTPEGAEIISTILPDRALKVWYPKASGVALWSVHRSELPLRSPSPLYVRDPDAIPARSLV